MMYELFWGTVTNLGDPILWSSAVIILVVVHYLLDKKILKFRNSEKHKKRLKNFLLLIIPTLFLALFGAEILKIIFQVPRPCIPCPAPDCNPFCLQTFSFPSGHTSTMTGVATAIFLLFGARKRYLPVFIFPILIGASRMALGVHTIFDVTAGFVIGLLVTYVVWNNRTSIYKWEDEVL
jgi:membrane-associated phospholipid phosphatase